MWEVLLCCKSVLQFNSLPIIFSFPLGDCEFYIETFISEVWWSLNFYYLDHLRNTVICGIQHLLALCQRDYSSCSISVFRPDDDRFWRVWKMGQNFLQAVLHGTEKDPTKQTRNPDENKEIKKQSYKCMLWSLTTTINCSSLPGSVWIIPEFVISD